MAMYDALIVEIEKVMNAFLLSLQGDDFKAKNKATIVQIVALLLSKHIFLTPYSNG